MSKTTKIILIVISGILLYFAYWYNFTTSGELWRVNQEIEKSWDRYGIQRTETRREERDYAKSVLNERETLNETKSLTSDSRNPIILEGKRNYVTGKNITYIIPKSMRRLILKIQDHLGRNITSYSLPNSFISVKPKQRITLEVQE
jgi:hypothetical protein